MRVFKWGDGLAVVLPVELVSALNLRAGDEVDIQATGKRECEALLLRLGAFRGRLPADFIFDREDANAR